MAPPSAAALMRHGAAILTSDEERRFMARAVDGKAGTLRREFVGQSAKTMPPPSTSSGRTLCAF